MAKHLDHYSAYGGSWACYDGSQYLYGFGVADFTHVLRKTTTGQAYDTRGAVTSIDASFTIRRIYATSTPGLIFIEAYKSNLFYLLKSEDYGATFTNVFTFGDGNATAGAQSTNVRLLNGFCECLVATPGGAAPGTLIIGEYNVNGSRVSGGVNDRVRIMKSSDHGSTWQQIMEWNTSGSQVGHIHAIYQDTHTGYVYFCVGDSNSAAGIIRWDGVEAWSNNTTLENITTNWTTGFKCASGTQHHRTVGMVFTSDYIFTFSDTQKPNNTTGVHSGIWRWNKDLSGPARVNNDIYAYDPMHIGWYGVNASGTLVFTSGVEYIDVSNAWTNINARLYVSYDQGVSWNAEAVTIGRTATATASVYQLFMCVVEDKIYLDNTAGAGHGSTDSLCFEDGIADGVTVIHPVRYIGAWGGTPVDSGTKSYSREEPGATLNFYLSNNRFSKNNRVRMKSGSYSEGGMYANISGSNAAFWGDGSLIIEGEGSVNTHVYRGSGIGYLLYFENSRILTTSTTPLLFKKIHLYNPSGANGHVYQGVDASYIQFRNDCKIGDETQNILSGSMIQVGSGHSLDIENCTIAHNPSAGAYGDMIVNTGTGGNISIKKSKIINGNACVAQRYAGSNLTLYNNIFYNYEGLAVLLWSGIVNQPNIKNNIFLGKAGSHPIQDLDSLVESGVDNNFYNLSNINLTDGGHSVTATDPKLVSASDYHLQPTSPCIGAGTAIAGITTDIEGNQLYPPYNIGPYGAAAGALYRTQPTTRTKDAKIKKYLKVLA